MKKCLILFLLFFVFESGNAQQKANYKLAEKFTRMGLSGVVSQNSKHVVPRYIHNGEKFWFEFRTDEGKKFYFVDPEKGEKRLLFNNTDIARGVSKYTRRAYDEKNLVLSDIDFSKDL